MNEIDTRDCAIASVQDLGMTRREQLQFTVGAFAAFALLGEARAAVPRRRISPRTWVDRHQEIAKAISSGQLRPRAWMTEVERLAAEVDVAELMASIDPAMIRSAGEPNHNDPRKRYVKFVDDAGNPRKLDYGAAFFDFGPTNVVTPHGHKHMVSAHMVVKGSFRVRNFDRLRDEGEAMVIKPTRDYIARVGKVSTMSSERDNIHWFVPHGGPATTFDVVISDLDPGQPSYDIKAIDPLGGRRLADGSIAAPIMNFGDSAARYTANV